MLNKIQLATMLILQDKMNRAVNEDWLQRNRAWLRAAMLEGAEAVEHHGWKWWKAQTKDLPQLQMEMVDIWHFALSAILVEFDGDMERSASTIAEQLASGESVVTFDGKDYEFGTMELLDKMDLMIGLAAAKRFSVPLFISIITDCELSSEELYRQYVGKNILNIFRQDHGYKAGTYVKIWNGREDNEYLVDVLNSLDINQADFSDAVYAGLKADYPG